MTSGYQRLLARGAADERVLGLILSGSQARDAGTEHSDFDVYVVVAEHVDEWRTSRTPELDTIVMSPAELADVSDEWQRYSYRGAKVLLDRMDGHIAELVRRQATLSPAESDAWVREYLDGYLNLIHRAGKSRRDGRPEAAELDEREAGPWFLWTLFALYGRVRPYNKYLRWELETHPLPAPWTADHLIKTLGERPSALFPHLESVVRAAGFGDVIDGWDDLHVRG